MHTSHCPTESRLNTPAASSQQIRKRWFRRKFRPPVLLTVPEVQTHRQLLPLAVARLMALARHVAAGHEPRRLLRTAGSTQRQR